MFGTSCCLFAFAFAFATRISAVVGSNGDREDSTIPIITENDDSITFPFYLNCQRWLPPPSPANASETEQTYEIVLNYHVDMVNNWRQIVRDQLHTLDKCGLGSAASSSFLVTYSNGEESDLKDFLREYSFSSQVTYESSKRQSQQGFTTSLKLDACREISEKQKQGIVFNFYAMGSQEYHWDWWRHRSQHDEGPYSRALYWRKYNEYFTIENPERCIDAIQNGALTCGVNLQAANGHWRYTDDFFVSSCDTKNRSIYMQTKRRRRLHQEFARQKALETIYRVIFLQTRQSMPNCTRQKRIGTASFRIQRNMMTLPGGFV